MGIGYERGVDQYRDLAPVFGQEVALQVPGVALLQAGGEAGQDLGAIPVHHQLRGQFSHHFPAPAEIFRQGFIGVGNAAPEVGDDHPVQHAVNGLDRHGGGGGGFLGRHGFGGASADLPPRQDDSHHPQHPEHHMAQDERPGMRGLGH